MSDPILNLDAVSVSFGGVKAVRERITAIAAGRTDRLDWPQWRR